MELITLALVFIGPAIIVPLTNILAEFIPCKTRRLKRLKVVLLPLLVLIQATMATFLVNWFFGLNMTREQMGLQIFGMHILSQFINEGSKKLDNVATDSENS